MSKLYNVKKLRILGLPENINLLDILSHNVSTSPVKSSMRHLKIIGADKLFRDPGNR